MKVISVNANPSAAARLRLLKLLVCPMLLPFPGSVRKSGDLPLQRGNEQSCRRPLSCKATHAMARRSEQRGMFRLRAPALVPLRVGKGEKHQS
jgi:hypothetical protein